MSEVKTSKLSPRTSSGTLTLGTSGDTFTVPSGVTFTNSGSATGFGKVLQVVSANKTDTASTTSTSFVATGLEVSITPSATSSKILINANPVFGGGVSAAVFSQLWRDSSVIIQADASGSRTRSSSGWLYVYTGYDGNPVPIVYLDSPSSTSSLTYKIMYMSSNASYTAYLNRSEQDADNANYGVGVSTITAMEIAG